MKLLNGQKNKLAFYLFKEKFGHVLHGFFLDMEQEVSVNKIIINKR